MKITQIIFINLKLLSMKNNKLMFKGTIFYIKTLDGWCAMINGSSR